MVAEAAVHTTGINWQSVAVITGVVITAMTFVFTYLARYVSNKVTGAINKLRIEVVSQLENRLTVVETKLVDIQSNVRRRLW